MQILQKKTVRFRANRTWIIRVEGKHADHLNTSTAHFTSSLICCLLDSANYEKYLKWKYKHISFGLAIITVL